MMFSSSIFQFSIVPDAPDFSSFPTQEATDLMQNVEFHVCETVPRDTNEGIEAIYAKTFDKITGSRTLRDQCRIHSCLLRGDNVANSKPITRFLRSFSDRSWKKLKGFCTLILEVDPLQYKLRYSLGPGVMRSPVDVAGNPFVSCLEFHPREHQATIMKSKAKTLMSQAKIDTVVCS